MAANPPTPEEAATDHSRTAASRYMGDHTFGNYRAAKKFYQCHDCGMGISAKDRYWYGVAMPNADCNSLGRPWVLRLCKRCKPEPTSPLSPSLPNGQ